MPSLLRTAVILGATSLYVCGCWTMGLGLRNSLFWGLGPGLAVCIGNYLLCLPLSRLILGNWSRAADISGIAVVVSAFPSALLAFSVAIERGATDGAWPAVIWLQYELPASLLLAVAIMFLARAGVTGFRFLSPTDDPRPQTLNHPAESATPSRP